MAGRMIATGVAFLAAFGASWSSGLISLGAFFLLFGAGIWHGWDAIRDGYACFRDSREPGGEGPPIMFVRLGPLKIKEMVGQQPRRV